MSVRVTRLHGETAQHARLKGLAFLWAQAQGFSACAMEVSLSKCRYRADVAAYRWQRKQPGSTAIFECKQALCDLRRDNCHSEATRRHLELICQRRQVLEARLRAHYPHLRNGDSLFPEFDSQNFIAIGHRGYLRLLRDLRALQNQLYDCTKFEKLIRYRCANLFFLCCPSRCFMTRRCRSAGARSWNQTGRSHSPAGQSGTTLQKKIAFAFCTELPSLEHDSQIGMPKASVTARFERIRGWFR